MSCEQCIRELRINNWLKGPLQNPSERIAAPEDAMQIDLVSKISPFGGYEYIVAAMDVFSRYIFVYPTSNLDPKTFANVIINMKTKHASLPMKIDTDNRSAFMTHLNNYVTEVLRITL